MANDIGALSEGCICEILIWLIRREIRQYVRNDETKLVTFEKKMVMFENKMVMFEKKMSNQTR